MSHVSREKVDASKIELTDTLEHYRKIFSSSYRQESTLDDLSLEFHNLNNKTQDFIRVTMKLVEELEGLLEKEIPDSSYESSLYDSFPSKHLMPIKTASNSECVFF